MSTFGVFESTKKIEGVTFKMKIVYLAKAFPEREYKILSSLKEMDKDLWAGLVEFSRGFYMQARQLNLSANVCDEIYDFTEYSEKHYNNYRTANIDALRKEAGEKAFMYSIKNPSMLKWNDKYLINVDEKEYLIKILLIYNFLENIIATTKPDAIIGELSSASDVIAYHMSDKLHIPYVLFWSARLENKMAISNLHDEWWKLDVLYQNYLIDGLDPEIVGGIKNYCEQRIEGSKVPDYMKYNRLDDAKAYFKRKEYKGNIFERLIKRMRTQHIDAKYAADYDHRIISSILMRVEKIMYPLKSLTINKYLSNKNSFSMKYVFFPLHYEPEASTMVFATEFMNQLATIEGICKLLPPGYLLVVKEHPSMYSKRAISFYKALGNMPNVVLIHSRVNVGRLITGAEAVITLTSTAGFEAILADKPVIVLGNVFYDKYKYARKVRSFIEVREAIDTIGEWFDANKEDRERHRLAFIAAVLNCALEGNVNNHLVDRSVLNKSNTEKIAKNILEYIKEYKKILN